MSAVIETIAGTHKGSVHWIEKSVVRLGNGDDCELQLDDPGIVGHAATVRFRNGQYTIYNRSDAPLRIGDHSLESEGSAHWKNGDTLSIGDGIALRLVIDGDPSPSTRRDDEVLRSYQEKRNEELRLKSVQAAIDAENAAAELVPEKPKANKSGWGNGLAVLALIVVLLGLLGLFGYLVIESGRPDRPAFNPRSVGRSLLARSSELPPTLVPLIQEAQQSVEMLNPEMAKIRLARLQSELDRLEAEGVELMIGTGKNRVRFDESLHAYINEYLSQLETAK